MSTDPNAAAEELVALLPAPAQPAAPATPAGRITVVEAVYHQPAGGPATQHGGNFTLHPLSQDEPYRRAFGPTEAWQPLPLPPGLDDAAALLLVANATPAAGPLVELGVASPAFQAAVRRTMHVPRPGPEQVVPLGPIPAGQAVRLTPGDRLPSYRVRCLGGPARCVVTVFPA